jgi:DEAD/DEAH box helicase
MSYQCYLYNDRIQSFLRNFSILILLLIASSFVQLCNGHSRRYGTTSNAAFVVVRRSLIDERQPVLRSPRRHQSAPFQCKRDIVPCSFWTGTPSTLVPTLRLYGSTIRPEQDSLSSPTDAAPNDGDGVYASDDSDVSSQHAQPSSSTTSSINEHEFWIDIGRRELQGLYPNFPLDDWQLQAGGAIWEGHNVVVSAPTGAGKTLVGEMALHIAFQQARKTGIYTTPLKALSNQKYMELSQLFGRNNTGLSTGDISINKGARITVMTTEVYRNIAWRSSSTTTTNTTSPTATTNSSSSDTSSTNSAVLNTKYYDELQENAVVVLDEFHYMGQPGRGGVWEESIIVSPYHTQIIGLSATLSNADSIVSWMTYVTGRRTVLVNVPNSCRPVPLRYLFATKDGLYPLFREKDAGPGAPLGLLGYRGDGIPSTTDMKKIEQSNKKKKNGFWNPKDDVEIEDFNETLLNGKKLPKGLQVNPALRDAAERRMERINRSIERLKIRNFSSGGGGGSSSYSRSRTKYDDYDSIQNSSKKRFNAKEEQKERERLLKKEMRRAVPSMYVRILVK